MTAPTTDATHDAIGSPPRGRAGELGPALARLADLADGQILVSQDRCVDALLDLYNASTVELDVRPVVAAVLGRIRYLSAVRASALSQLAGELLAILALADLPAAPAGEGAEEGVGDGPTSASRPPFSSALRHRSGPRPAR